jgi:ATP/maltotriose-dependent transcriptional regulator MalT
VGVVSDVERGRELYARRAWAAAYEALSTADPARLGAGDLEVLASAAFMTGHDEAYAGAWERAYRAHLGAGDASRAARCTWWIGDYLRFRGDTTRATGWFARGQRLLERVGHDCVARGFLRMPIVHERAAAGDHEAALALAVEAGEIGERLGDRDLTALAMMEQGHALVRQGRVDEGLRLVDETLVTVTAEEPAPVIAGTVYCSTIAFCQSVFELGRAREWTEAHTRWCERQPEMVAYMGLCLVHRAEIMTLAGDWPKAIAEARRAEAYRRGVLNERAAGHAAYRRGEVHFLQGELRPAEEAYREASRRGHDPQPGLALLRLAQGEGESAGASLRRALGEATEPLRRAALLPAYVEIMLAVGRHEEARESCRELEAIAGYQGSRALGAMADYARGAADLAGGDASAALVTLRRACRAWQELEAPRETARTRVLVGQVCAALGDPDTAALELEAAAETFARLGARAELARVESLARPPADRDAHGLTARELEILRLLATGESNREIAAALVISDHTVRRHVQNIFAKLGVSSRAAATAFAFRHGLL